ncbi:MAG TPA: nucleoside hydrolase [Chthoniobacterales bacterium]
MCKALVFAAIVAVARVAAAETVWIDTDVSIGSPFREVDDAYALVLAFHSPELRIAGISASYGNAPLAYTTQAAHELAVQFAPKNARVFAGAKSPKDLGQPTEASNALAKVLAKESAIYIALGPLTNLATFIELHPDMTRQIKRVIFVGGHADGKELAFGPKGAFHIHDANVFKDPRAAAVLLRSGIPITLASVATSRDLSLTENDLRDLAHAGPAANYLARRSKVWLWFWTRFVGTDGGPIFDALAVMTAARPALVSIDRCYARMNNGGDMILSSNLTTGGRRVQFCKRLEPDLKRTVLERLSQP